MERAAATKYQICENYRVSRAYVMIRASVVARQVVHSVRSGTPDGVTRSESA